MILDRRRLLLSGLAFSAPSMALAAADPGVRASTAQLTALGKRNEAAFASHAARKTTDAQWKAMLPPRAYSILRHEDTEAPGTSPLLDEKRKGRFVCLGCDLPLFESSTKYESGTGWPSYYDFIPGSLGFKTDNLLGYVRVEYHCARCLGHHGHRFTDGPRPTGVRYCSNGAALKFVPA